MLIDDKYKEWATPRQIEIIDAVNKHGSYRGGAKSLGVAITGVRKAIKSVENKAAKSGFAPEYDYTHVVPDGFTVKGVSTYYAKTGDRAGQWVKSSVDNARQYELAKAMIEAMIDDLQPVKVTSSPLDWQDDVIPWLQIGDAHIGMLAYANETGENFDLKIGERELCTAIGMLIDELPNCERMVVNDLGDLSHYQNFAGLSESGHQFDIDTRYPKMIQVCVRVMRFIIEKCLTKAKNLDLIINQGNHSRVNDIWMRVCLDALYGSTNRVHILNNENVFIGYRMGNTLVMTHHSDKCRPNKLANVMTTDFQKDYGETEFHYIDIGHVHHGMVMKEHPGIIIESFNHLASLDKWAHDFGYRNRKSITIILRSKKYGEVGRRLLPIQEIRDKLLTMGHPIPEKKKPYTI